MSALILPRGYTLYRRARLDSTNSAALSLAAEGAPHGTVVMADMQSAGRGRRGRRWISLPGNLFLTILARPAPERPVSQLAFAAALAIGEVLRGFDGISFKWPNDVLLHGRKIAGVLIEADGGAAAVGLGVNLIAAPDDPSVAAGHLGGRLERHAAAAAACRGFERWYRKWQGEGFAPLRRAWSLRAAGLSAPATVAGCAGRFVGIDAGGGLVLEIGRGRERVVTAGEVRLWALGCC